MVFIDTELKLDVVRLLELAAALDHEGQDGAEGVGAGLAPGRRAANSAGHTSSRFRYTDAHEHFHHDSDAEANDNVDHDDNHEESQQPPSGPPAYGGGEKAYARQRLCATDVESRMSVRRISTPEGLLQCVAGLELEAMDHGISLLVIDSISAVVRGSRCAMGILLSAAAVVPFLRSNTT